MNRIPATCIAVSSCLLISGCASGPSGGLSTNTNAANRLECTITLNNTIDPNAYYAVAFDDNPNDVNGPAGIDGNTTVLNGVVGGDWRVMVMWNLNTFEVFTRTDPTNPATEVRTLVSPFVGTPTAQNNTVDFTINLDALTGPGAYFFPHSTTGQLSTNAFLINCVTTNTIIRSSNDNRIKPVDALGPYDLSTPVNVAIDSTRTTAISDPVGDERPDVDSSFLSYNFGQIDITNLALNITRA